MTATVGDMYLKWDLPVTVPSGPDGAGGTIEFECVGVSEICTVGICTRRSLRTNGNNIEFGFEEFGWTTETLTGLALSWTFLEYITQLSDADAQVRLRAARDIFDWGTRLCDPVTAKWMANRELAALLVRVVGEAGASARAETADHSRASAGGCAVTVGIAVQPGTVEKIREANGAPALAEVPPDQDATEFELEFPGHVRIDVLTTDAPRD